MRLQNPKYDNVYKCRDKVYKIYSSRKKNRYKNYKTLIFDRVEQKLNSIYSRRKKEFQF